MATSTAVGLKEANRALKRLPEHVREDAQTVFNVTAFQFIRGAVAMAPKGETGQLSESIEWKPRPRSLAAVVLIDKRTAYYWKFQEFGTVHHDAHPFLRPTAVRLSPDHQARLKQSLTKGLSKLEREARG